jgi:hypothetical protein
MTDDPTIEDPDLPPPPTVGEVLPEAPESYQQTLGALIERVRAARVRALRSVNQELVLLYWDIGCQASLERSGAARVSERAAMSRLRSHPSQGILVEHPCS